LLLVAFSRVSDFLDLLHFNLFFMRFTTLIFIFRLDPGGGGQATGNWALEEATLKLLTEPVESAAPMHV
jgi:hypothetical protein